MSGLDDDMSGLGDMGALDQEKINEFRTLVRDARDAWQEATERRGSVPRELQRAEHGRGTANRSERGCISGDEQSVGCVRLRLTTEVLTSVPAG